MLNYIHAQQNFFEFLFSAGDSDQRLLRRSSEVLDEA